MQTPLLGFRPTRQGLFVPGPAGLPGFTRQGMNQAKKVAFNPAQVPGVILWWDSTDLGSMTILADKVNGWRDKIRGVTATAVTLNSNTLSTIGGTRTVVIPSGSELTAVYTPGGPQLATQRLSLLAVAVVTGGMSGFAPSIIAVGGLGLGVAGSDNAGSPPTGSAMAVRGGSFRDTSTSPTLTNNARGYILSLRTNLGAPDLLRVDGAAPSGGSLSSGMDDLSATTGVEIGTRPGGSEDWSGAAGDLIVGYNVSLEDHIRLEGYLAWKFNQQSFLPSTHPFKNSPP
jgi:hypothetical protein